MPEAIHGDKVFGGVPEIKLWAIEKVLIRDDTSYFTISIVLRLLGLAWPLEGM